MILYHCTPEERIDCIRRDKCLKAVCDRYFTGNGATTQGYVYLSNEPTYSIYFANCHLIDCESAKMYLFQFDLPIELLEPDYDEMKINHDLEFETKDAVSTLEYSLSKYKSCRVPFDIKFAQFPAKYCSIDESSVDILAIIKHAGYDYQYVIDNYTDTQKKFLESLKWTNI